jgi:hypothetical protein
MCVSSANRAPAVVVPVSTSPPQASHGIEQGSVAGFLREDLGVSAVGANPVLTRRTGR